MKEFEKWFQKAENDLLNIWNNLKSENIPADTCCFHAQQAAEKYLKAYLVSKGIEFPKTHDLELLVKLSARSNSRFAEILPPAFKLLDYSIAPRYLDVTDDLTVEDAKQAYANAIIIKDFILKHFFE